MKRRTFLGISAGIASIVAVSAWKRNSLFRWFLTTRKNEGVILNASADNNGVCKLTPEQIEGPYNLKSPNRSDIREDRPGIPLSLDFRIVKGEDCQPVEGATVQIWHCDSAGVYSGYSEDMARKPFDTFLQIAAAGGPSAHIEATNEKRFLRGMQTSDNDGRLKFQTIFPGWYDPRVPHIHIKVLVGEQSYLTTQLYFPDELCQSIYASNPDYNPHGQCPYNHENDLVLGGRPDANGLLLEPKKITDGLSATATLRITTST